MNTQEQSQTGIFPRFYMEARQSKPLTEQRGYPQFVDREMVEIRIAGDNKTVVVKKVDEEHKNRWPRQYEAFKKGLETPIDGLPLKHCPLFSMAEVQTMLAQNIYTVEALANLNDGFISRLGMSARGWVAKAQAYLKSAEGSADAVKMAADNQKLRDEIESLKLQIKELGQMMSSSNQEVQEVQEVEVKTLPDTLEGLNLANKTYNALRRAGVDSIERLTSMSPDELSSLPGIGVTMIDEITRRLS